MRFTEAMDDDLNVSAAWAAVFDWVRDTNRKLTANGFTTESAATELANWEHINNVLGIESVEEEAPAEIMARRVTERQRNVSDADAKILGEQLTYDLGEIEWFRIDSSGPRQETLKAGLGLIGLETGVA